MKRVLCVILFGLYFTTIFTVIVPMNVNANGIEDWEARYNPIEDCYGLDSDQDINWTRFLNNQLFLNQPPIANAGHDQTVREKDIVTFDGSGSYDPDVRWGRIKDGSACNKLHFPNIKNPHNDKCVASNFNFISADKGDYIVSYNWHFGDGSSHGRGVAPVHVYDNSGIYTVTLTVMDKYGATDTDTCIISVLPENHHPVANAGPDQTVYEGDLVQFDGINSTGSMVDRLLGFGPNVRVNSDPGVAYQFYPSIAVDDLGNIHIVYMGNRTGERNLWDAYYAVSFDGGKTFSNFQIPFPIGTVGIPVIDVSASGTAHFAFEGIDYAGHSDIYYTNTTDFGQTFATCVKVNEDTGLAAIQQHPDLAVSDTGEVFIVWEEYYGILLSSSTDGFVTNIKVNDPGNYTTFFPSIAVDKGGNIYVVWFDDRNRVFSDYMNWDIYASSSTDGGVSFGADVRVNDDNTTVVDQYHPKVAGGESGEVYVVWEDRRGPSWNDIFFAKSSDGGVSFEPNVKVNDENISQQWSPSISISRSGIIHVSWWDKREGRWDVYYANSDDGGKTFNKNLRVDDAIDEKIPIYDSIYVWYKAIDIAVDSTGNPHIVWHDKRNGDFDIYYAHGNVTVGEEAQIASYEWDFDANIDSDGDGNTTNDVDATGPKPTHIYGDDGVYIVTLTVTDDQGLSKMDTMVVTVKNVAPIIAPLGPFIVDEGSQFILTAICSDKGSDDLTFMWEFEFGPTITNVVFNDGLGLDPYPSPWGAHPFSATDIVEHIYGDNGVYRVTLTVEDDDGGSTTFTTNITVNNVAPTIENIEAYVYIDFTLRVAGEKWHNVELYIYENEVEIGYGEVIRYPGSPDDQSITIGNVKCDVTKIVTLMVLYTPDDDPINGQLKGADPCWVNITFEDGSYELLHHIFIVEHPETWNWKIDLSQFLTGREITFEATASDSGSDDLMFTWNWGDGTLGSKTIYYENGISPDPYPSPWGSYPFTARDEKKHTYSRAGNYTVILTVTDDDSGTNSDTVIVTIDNIGPVACAQGPYFGNEGTFITFAGVQTSPNAFSVFTYYWDFGDNHISALQNPTHIYETHGIYTVTLMVMNECGESDIDICDVNVNAKPIADSGPNQTVYVGDRVRFNGSRSYDIDGCIFSYEWDFDAKVDMDGDGNFINDGDAIVPSTQHIYNEEGEYHITLLVSDGFSVSMDTLIVIVLPIVSPLANSDPDYEIDFEDSPIDSETIQDGHSALSEKIDEDAKNYIDHIITEEVGYENLSDESGDIDHDEIDDESTGEPHIQPSEDPINKPKPDVPIVTITVSISSIIISTLALSLPLYMKINRKDLLKHRTRKLIYKYISTNPGDNFNAIKQALDLSNGVLSYHLQILERENFIISNRDGGYKRFYPLGKSKMNNIKRFNGVQKDILSTIKNFPGISQTEIAEKTGTTVQVVNYHIKRLQEEGLIKLQMTNGHRSQCFLQNCDEFQLT